MVPFFGGRRAMRRRRTSMDVPKIGDGHGGGTGNGGVGGQGGQGDSGVAPDFGDRAFAHDLCDFVEQRLAGLRDDVSKNDVCRIESVDDGDRAVPNVSGNIEHQKRRGLVSRVRLGEQCCASLRMRHRLASGNDARVGVELFVDGVGGAVAFQASDIAAVAWLAVHVDGDVSDFRGGAVLAVVDGAVVDDSEADAFAKQIVGEGTFRQFRIEQELRQRASAGVLFDEHGDAECVAEFVDEVDLPPALHGGDQSGASFVL